MAVCRAVKESQADEIALEIGKDFDFVFKYFVDKYKYYSESRVLYAAPLNSNGKMARKKKHHYLLRFSNEKLTPVNATTSDEFVDKRLGEGDVRTAFDPCVGKGLLTMFCAKHGVESLGFDFNESRLDCAAEILEVFSK